MDRKTKKLVKDLIPRPSNVSKDAVITIGVLGTGKKMKDSLNDGDANAINTMATKQTFNGGVRKLAAEENKDDKMKYIGLATGIGLAGASTLYGLKTGKIKPDDIINPAKKFAKKVSPAYKGFANAIGVANSRKNKNIEVAKLKEMFKQYNPNTMSIPLNFDGFREMYEMYKAENKVVNNPNSGQVSDFLNYIKENSGKYLNNKQKQAMRNFQEQTRREGNAFGLNIDKKKLEKNILTGMGLLSSAAMINTGINASNSLYDKAIKKDEEFKVNENIQETMRNEARKIISQEYKNQQRNKYKKRNNLKYSKVKKVDNNPDGITKQAKILTKEFLKQNIGGNTLNSIAYTGTSIATAGVINRMVNGKPKEENKNGNTAIIDVPVKTFNKMISRKSKKVLDKEIEKKAYDYSNARKKIKKGLDKVLPSDMPKQLAENAFRGVTRTAPIALATSLAAKKSIDVSTKTGVTKKKQVDPLESFDPVQQGSVRIMIQKPNEGKK